MAKKKKTNQQPLDERRYLREKCRTLPMHECCLNKNWDESGVAIVMVSRRHPKGQLTVGVYYLDTFCLGLKRTRYDFAIPEFDYEEIKNKFYQGYVIENISYEEAHNLVYGAIAFAEEAGIKPAKEFNTHTQYILEEDTDDVPLIEYEFGKDGEYFLVAMDKNELRKYTPYLNSALGPDGYTFMVCDNDDEDDEDDEDDIFSNIENDPDMIDMFDSLKAKLEYSDSLPNAVWNHELPLQYQQNLPIVRREVLDLLGSDYMSIKYYRELRRINVTADELNNVVVTELQNLYKSEGLDDSPFNAYRFLNAISVMEEVHNEDSAAVLLEAIRISNDMSYDYIGDACPEIFVPTLKRLFINDMLTLENVFYERGLDYHAKLHVTNTIFEIAMSHPELYSQSLDAMKRILNFCAENITDTSLCGSDVASFAIWTAADFCNTDLLTYIKRIMDTGYSDRNIIGTYESIEKDVRNPFYKKKASYQSGLENRLK